MCLGFDDRSIHEFRSPRKNAVVLLIEMVTTKHTSDVETPLTRSIEEQLASAHSWNFHRTVQPDGRIRNVAPVTHAQINICFKFTVHSL